MMVATVDAVSSMFAPYKMTLVFAKGSAIATGSVALNVCRRRSDESDDGEGR